MSTTRDSAFLVKIGAVLVFLSLSFLTPLSYAAIVAVGPNISIVNLPQDRQQVEPTIAVDPRNSSILVAGAQDYRLKATGGHRWHGYYRSTDGGSTWVQSLLPGFLGDNSPQGLASPLKSFNATSDPVLAFDRGGNVYYTGIAFNIDNFGSVSSLRAFVAKYINDGAAYSGVVLIGGLSSHDKPWIAVDTKGGSSDGNVYVAFDAVVSGLFTSVFTRSTDGGATFSTPVKVPAGCGGLPGVTVDPSGNVYVSTIGCDPVTGQNLDIIQVSKLTGGGSVLASTVTAVDPITPLPSPLPGNGFRTFTIPQMAADANGIYLVWDDFGSGNADAMFSRSTNGGSSWTAGLRLSDVSTGHQFYPTVISSGGIISVAWYDSRLNSGATITALDVFYTHSTDGGLSFTPNRRITSRSFDPNLVKRTDPPSTNDPFIGDYIHIAAGPTTVYPIWADNRNACDTVDPVFGCVDQDVFTAKITVSAGPFHNVAVQNLTASRSFAYAGVASNPIRVNVTVANLGSFDETFTLILFANSTVIGTRTLVLGSLGTLVAQFSWNAHQFPVGPYVLSAEASQVTGETYLADNVFSDGTFSVRFNGDLNGDCKVTIVDIATIAFAFDTTPSSALWNPDADLNNDGRVDIVDVAVAALNFDRACQ